jgi:NAD(P)-dependent dehydrogenase (short-subunit alcohol dehydrogenase family)
MNGDVVLITGASTGFGRVSAEMLSTSGYRVIATMRDIAGRNASAAAELRGIADVVEIDVTDDPSVDRGMAEAERIAGRIDVVINNAGFGNIGVTEAYTVDEVRQVFETNFFGVQRVTRAVLPGMRARRKGLLINVSSVAGRTTVPYMGPYCASKHALESLSDAYRSELAPFGVDCVVVEPGVFNTPIFGKVFSPADEARVASYGAENHQGRVMNAFASFLNDPALPPVSLVAETFQRLIETPLGQRPFRTHVGAAAEFLEFLNPASEQIRAGTAEAFGVTNLLTQAQAKGAGE